MDSETTKRKWLTISVEALKIWAALLALIAVSALSYVGYRVWDGQRIQRTAAELIEETRTLQQRVGSTDSAPSYSKELDEAQQSLETAQLAYGEGDFQHAAESSLRSRNLLLSIRDAIENRGRAGEAQFISVHGRVEYRRVDSSAWDEASSRVALFSGDYVKTAASGSAEIMFLNGNLFTVRPNTLFVVSHSAAPGGGPGEQTVDLEWGELKIGTARAGSKVTTPGADAQVGTQSEAIVTYDSDSRIGRFANYRGEMRVAAEDGSEVRIGELQLVTDAEGKLSKPRPLPGMPSLLQPVDNLELERSAGSRLELAWQEVDGAVRYALQVSRNSLFVDNLVDVADRKVTSATLGLQGEGSFQWRVAALDGEGVQGPWSSTHRFRVVAEEGTLGSVQDNLPPQLNLGDVRTYGSIVIVGGRTEAGSALTVNSEPTIVAADGTFTKTIEVIQEGWIILEVVARDAAGNETVRRPRVFVESL